MPMTAWVSHETSQMTLPGVSRVRTALTGEGVPLPWHLCFLTPVMVMDILLHILRSYTAASLDRVLSDLHAAFLTSPSTNLRLSPLLPHEKILEYVYNMRYTVVLHPYNHLLNNYVLSM